MPKKFQWMTVFLTMLAVGGLGIPSRAQDAGLARTPPMGWSTWYSFACHATDASVRAQAKAMATDAMKAAGYTYVNIDDCWEGTRDARGFIQPNGKFPDMKGLADYVHSLGLKLGIYSSPGPKTCGGYEGSYGHEEQDAETYARWGMDFLKYDWCSAENVYRPDQMEAAYRKMQVALLRTRRPILYSLCQYGLEGVWKWGRSVGGNMWRTTDDITDNYYIIMLWGLSQRGLERYAGPHGWNDPDNLQIGRRLQDQGPEAERRVTEALDQNEEKSQMSLWCILAAPLIAGNDLTSMSQATRAILTNREVIAVDQDRGGIQGRLIRQTGPLEVWMKPLTGGAKAVGLFNTDWGPMPIRVDFREIGVQGSAAVRDLWAHRDLGTFQNSFTAKVPKHGVLMIKITSGVQ
jgi:alpha-galactosidase